MDLTILIKTFKRQRCFDRLISSIRSFYPKVKIIYLDDSFEDSRHGFNIGVSKGRNILVSECKTKYCMILDDDCVFTSKTNLEKAIKILEENDLDILELSVPGLDYKGLFKIDGDRVDVIPGNRNGLYDIVNQIFIAKTEILKKYTWDEELKIGEHTAFFFVHRGKMKIGSTREVMIDHKHESNEEYNQYRSKGFSYIEKFMRKSGIKTLHAITGETITI